MLGTVAVAVQSVTAELSTFTVGVERLGVLRVVQPVQDGPDVTVAVNVGVPGLL